MTSVRDEITPDGRASIDTLECLAYLNGWRLIRPNHLRKVIAGKTLTEAEIGDIVRATQRGP